MLCVRNTKRLEWEWEAWEWADTRDTARRADRATACSKAHKLAMADTTCVWPSSILEFELITVSLQGYAGAAAGTPAAGANGQPPLPGATPDASGAAAAGATPASGAAADPNDPAAQYEAYRAYW